MQPGDNPQASIPPGQIYVIILRCVDNPGDYGDISALNVHLSVKSPCMIGSVSGYPGFHTPYYCLQRTFYSIS